MSDWTVCINIGVACQGKLADEAKKKSSKSEPKKAAKKDNSKAVIYDDSTDIDDSRS